MIGEVRGQQRVLVSVQAATYRHLAVGITGQTIGAQRDISRIPE
jgi:hypothetical protein